MTATIHVGPLEPQQRSRIEEIVRATGVFSDEESAVALELFDSAQKATMDNGEWKMGTEHHGAATHSPFSIVHSP